jgi:hypothetical protein
MMPPILPYNDLGLMLTYVYLSLFFDISLEINSVPITIKISGYIHENITQIIY